MPSVIRCSKCNTLIRIVDDRSPQDRKCPQCGAANTSTETIAQWSRAEEAETKKLIREEEGAVGEGTIPGSSHARNVWIPLAMIVVSIAARIAIFFLITHGILSDAGLEVMAFRLVLSYVIALSIYEASLEFTFAAVLGIVAMVIQSRILGTAFGTFGAAMLKVVALMMFAPTIAGGVLFLLIYIYQEEGAKMGCLFLGPVFVGSFFLLTKWFFDLDVFEAIVFAAIVLLGPVVASQTVEWGIENAGPMIDAVRAHFQ